MSGFLLSHMKIRTFYFRFPVVLNPFISVLCDLYRGYGAAGRVLTALWIQYLQPSKPTQAFGAIFVAALCSFLLCSHWSSEFSRLPFVALFKHCALYVNVRKSDHVKYQILGDWRVFVDKFVSTNIRFLRTRKESYLTLHWMCYVIIMPYLNIICITGNCYH